MFRLIFCDGLLINLLSLVGSPNFLRTAYFLGIYQGFWVFPFLFGFKKIQCLLHFFLYFCIVFILFYKLVDAHVSVSSYSFLGMYFIFLFFFFI